MASVFKAYEASLDRYVALKVLPPEFLHDPTFAERFRREAQTIARLEHPQIIPIFAYDIDTASGTPWMAMRLISGGSLSQKIKKGRLSPSESARILKDVADALDYAHSAGVIHRDVKPQNVLLDDAGRVYLADFGIAKMVEASAHMTQTGMITGTPQYMAPEQALGKTIDKSIDIYALGIVAYELFTGRVPFSADTPVAVLMKQASEPMPLPSAAEVPEEVTRAILRATAKDPAARWPSAAAFAAAVGNAVTSTGSTAPTAMLDAIGQETVAGMTAPGIGQAETIATRPTPVTPQRGASAPSRTPTPIPAARTQGGGLGMVAAIVIGLAMAGVGAAYLVYQSFRSSQTATTASAPSTTPVIPVPVAAETPAPPPVVAATPVVEPTVAVATSTTPEPAEVPPHDVRRPNEFRPLTPLERRMLRRDPEARRERMEAIANARLQAAGEETASPTATVAAPVRPVVRTTRINLEVEASQPSTGAQISALFAEVLIDGRRYREFPIRFAGGNSFARWKKVENIVLENVPLNAREITLAVATDQGLNSERMEGSTRLALEGEETSMSVVVRFYNQFDKSVRFR